MAKDPRPSQIAGGLLYNVCLAKGGTYQPHSKKQDLEYSPDGGGADNVAVAHSGHGDHEEIHTLPIAQLVHLAKVRQVATVLQLFFFRHRFKRRVESGRVRCGALAKSKFRKSDNIFLVQGLQSTDLLGGTVCKPFLPTSSSV